MAEKSNNQKVDPKLAFIHNFDHEVESTKVKRKLTRTFSGLEGYKKDIAKGLIDELASVKAGITYSKANYEYFGSVEDMPQGDYTISRTSPHFTNYEKGLKQYAALYKQLLDLYPKDEQKTKLTVEADPLTEFMSGYQKR